MYKPEHDKRVVVIGDNGYVARHAKPEPREMTGAAPETNRPADTDLDGQVRK